MTRLVPTCNLNTSYTGYTVNNSFITRLLSIYNLNGSYKSTQLITYYDLFIINNLFMTRLLPIYNLNGSYIGYKVNNLFITRLLSIHNYIFKYNICIL